MTGFFQPPMASTTGERHTLLNRGQHEHIECRQHLGNVGARAEERHVPLDIEGATLRLQFSAETPISNNEQSRRLTMSNERLKRPAAGYGGPFSGSRRPTAPRTTSSFDNPNRLRGVLSTNAELVKIDRVGDDMHPR